MNISAHDGLTDITGQITDPAHLQGLLERIAGLGLTLHSLTPLEADNGEARRAAPSSTTSSPRSTTTSTRCTRTTP
jgi:hypothetical protein